MQWKGHFLFAYCFQNCALKKHTTLLNRLSTFFFPTHTLATFSPSSLSLATTLFDCTPLYVVSHF
jgi:hypothetical protein